MVIKKIIAGEILDSRGNPTVETRVMLDSGIVAVASVPSGASTGRHEALELRDQDKRYHGWGVLQACKNVNTMIARALVGKALEAPEKIDRRLRVLDPTERKTKLGANALLSVSLACARAGALARNIPLWKFLAKSYGFKIAAKPKIPTPLFNVFNGGKHADTNLDFQEFWIVPTKRTSYAEKLRMGAEIFHALGRELHHRGYDTDTGAEGGYAPQIRSSIEVLDLLMRASRKAGYVPDKDVVYGIDAGASVLYDRYHQRYRFRLDHQFLDAHHLIELYRHWVTTYPVRLIEDGLAEDDWQNWVLLMEAVGAQATTIGDDLFVTNVKRLERGIETKAVGGVIVKPNQIGTLSETVAFVKCAQAANLKVIVSHRSGETNDDFIADLAVAVGADYLKAGAPNRGERLAKWNRLLAIERGL